jgi:hypothetical protein
MYLTECDSKEAYIPMEVRAAWFLHHVPNNVQHKKKLLFPWKVRAAKFCTMYVTVCNERAAYIPHER